VTIYKHKQQLMKTTTYTKPNLIKRKPGSGRLLRHPAGNGLGLFYRSRSAHWALL